MPSNPQICGFMRPRGVSRDARGVVPRGLALAFPGECTCKPLREPLIHTEQIKQIIGYQDTYSRVCPVQP